MKHRKRWAGRPRAVRGDEASDIGVARARQRVEDVLESFSRLQLHVVVVPPANTERESSRDRARRAAIVAGRIALYDEAVAAARDIAMRSFARGGFSGTWAVTDMAASVVRAADRVSASAALEEAAIAAVVDDLVDDGTLEILRSTADDLFGLREIPSPGSLASLGTPLSGNFGSQIPVAIATGFALVFGIVGFVIGGVAGLVTMVLALAVFVGLVRRRPQSDP